jgi:hypothetical protein
MAPNAVDVDTFRGIKAYGVFRVTARELEITEPKAYPAVYGGSITDNDGSEVIWDFVYIADEKAYKKFVERLKEVQSRLREKVNMLDKAISQLDNLSLSIDFWRHAQNYTSIISDEDYDILKAGWQLGVKRYDKESRIAGIVGYEQWPGYEGLDRATSERINAFLWDMAFAKRRFGLDEIVMELKNRFGLDEKKAELIVRTEFANIFNKMREWAYKEKTEVKKFKWVAKEDACEKCRQIAEVSKRGVTLDELKELIKQYGGPYAREWTVHPNCRCTFVRKAGRKKRWE